MTIYNTIFFLFPIVLDGHAWRSLYPFRYVCTHSVFYIKTLILLYWAPVCLEDKLSNILDFFTDNRIHWLGVEASLVNTIHSDVILSFINWQFVFQTCQK